ncbi:MAG: hypothetical protein NTY18_01590, partial [Deltaproteobacteria bacterium]|nr:hypothetical protein [Deltaproteobacteria bacterium]
PGRSRRVFGREACFDGLQQSRSSMVGFQLWRLSVHGVPSPTIRIAGTGRGDRERRADSKEAATSGTDPRTPDYTGAAPLKSPAAPARNASVVAEPAEGAGLCG